MIDTEALIDEWLNIAKRTDAMTDDDRRICMEMVQEIGKILDIKIQVKFVLNSKVSFTIDRTRVNFYHAIDSVNNLDLREDYGIEPDGIQQVIQFQKSSNKIRESYLKTIPLTDDNSTCRRHVSTNYNEFFTQLFNIGQFFYFGDFYFDGIIRGFCSDKGLNSSPLERCLALLQKHCGHYVFDRSLCIIGDRPSVMSFDDQGRFHNEIGPSFAERDEFGQDTSISYSLHGVKVSPQLVMEPESITIRDIRYQQNVEVRRHMMEKFGYERLLRESKAKLISEEHGIGKLYQIRLGNEKLTVVEVVNSTPEPDGSYRRYWLRVPPRMKTARQAVAWTFGKTETDYQPEVET